MSVLLYYNLIVKWSNKVLLNIINLISFKLKMIIYNIERINDID
jgi:hypothetical protein